MRSFIGVVALILLLLVFVLIAVKIGWSLFMVPVFGLKELTYSEALGLLILGDMLFKSSGKVKDLVKES